METDEETGSQVFVFEDPQQTAEKDHQRYINGEILVEPRAVFSNIATLKSWIDNKRQLEKQLK